MTLNDRIALWVEKAHGGNLSAAARAADIPIQTFWQIHSGMTKSPTAPHLVKLAAAMDVTIDFLLTGAQHG